MIWVHLTKADILVGIVALATVLMSMGSFVWWLFT